MSKIYKPLRRSDIKGHKKTILQGFAFQTSKMIKICEDLLCFCSTFTMTQKANDNEYEDTVKTKVKFKEN